MFRQLLAGYSYNVTGLLAISDHLIRLMRLQVNACISVTHLISHTSCDDVTLSGDGIPKLVQHAVSGIAK